MKKWGTIGLLIHLILGLYFINIAFSFVILPAMITELNKWFIFIGGLLIIFAGLTHLVKKGKREKKEF